MHLPKRWLPLCAALCLCASGAAWSAGEADTPSAEQPFKLTVADFRYASAPSGQDANLRWRSSDSSYWVGYYHDPTFGAQSRVGFDTSIALGESTTLQPSLQAASRGFAGGSVNLQMGDPWFALVGWGRTNLKPYFNLNFDPNDAITLGAGWHGPGGKTLSLTLVADDRLHTRQRHWHAFARWPLTPSLRGTFDLLRKTGDGDTGPVRAWGWSATLDFPTWFLRLARDPKQNFSSQDVTRIAAGLRF